jgi:hypothetical protein
VGPRFAPKETTVPVVDGEAGVECQLDFGQMGFLADPDGRRRKVHALIFTAVVSRHMFVWLSFSQTLAAVIAGCEAAFAHFGGYAGVVASEVGARSRGWCSPSRSADALVAVPGPFGFG